jgi:hypothetical protein
MSTSTNALRAVENDVPEKQLTQIRKIIVAAEKGDLHLAARLFEAVRKMLRAINKNKQASTDEKLDAIALLTRLKKANRGDDDDVPAEPETPVAAPAAPQQAPPLARTYPPEHLDFPPDPSIYVLGSVDMALVRERMKYAISDLRLFPDVSRSGDCENVLRIVLGLNNVEPIKKEDVQRLYYAREFEPPMGDKSLESFLHSAMYYYAHLTWGFSSLKHAPTSQAYLAANPDCFEARMNRRLGAGI